MSADSRTRAYSAALKAEINDDEVEGLAGKFEDARRRFERNQLMLTIFKAKVGRPRNL